MGPRGGGDTEGAATFLEENRGGGAKRHRGAPGGTARHRDRPTSGPRHRDRARRPDGRPDGRTHGPPDKLYLATRSHCGIVTRTQLRTHARNAKASAIEIDF